MSIGTWVALGVLLAFATGFYVVTQTGAEIEARVRAGRPGPPEEIGLGRAILVLLQEALRPVRWLARWFSRKPARKHSAQHLGKRAVRVTTLQTVCGR